MVRYGLTVVSVLIGLLLLLFAGTVWLILQPLDILAVPPQERQVFSNITVVNPRFDRQAGQTVTVEDGNIVSITASSPNSPPPESTKRFAGTYMLPGLIDMHAHHLLVDQDLHDLLFLMHGVTTIRDIGFPDFSMVERRNQVRDGVYPGPRYFACGPILDADPPWPQPWFWSVPTPDEARTAVDEIAAAGVDCVKVYSGLSEEVLTAVREAARQHSIPVVGHVPAAIPFEAAHISDVQHLTGIPATSNGVATTQAERRAQFSASWWAWHELDETRMDFIVHTSQEPASIKNSSSLLMQVSPPKKPRSPARAGPVSSWACQNSAPYKKALQLIFCSSAKIQLRT